MSQTVKEVLQGLVDDGLVQAEKIGSSNCAYMRAQQDRADGPSLLELSITEECYCTFSLLGLS